MWELAPETVLARPYPARWPLAGMMQGMTAEGVESRADEPTLTDIITYSEESLKQVWARLGLAGDPQ
jgi:hypothetical protein